MDLYYTVLIKALIENVILKPIAQALNDGFTAYRWDNDLEVHLYQEIEKRVKNPAGKEM